MPKDRLEIWSNSSLPNHLSQTKTPKQAHDKIKSIDRFMETRKERVEDVLRSGTLSGDLLGLTPGFPGNSLSGMCLTVTIS